MRPEVEKVLDSIRPALQADGGDVELVDIDGGVVKVRLTGACNGCPMANMTLKGGIVMIPLGICSIVGLAVAIERAISLRRSKIIPPGFVNRLMETFNGDSGSQEAAIELCEGCPGPVGVIFKAGIQIHVHSIGDAATRLTLDGFEYARQQNGKRDARSMVTHLQLVNQADIARFADLEGDEEETEDPEAEEAAPEV